MFKMSAWVTADHTKKAPQVTCHHHSLELAIRNAHCIIRGQIQEVMTKNFKFSCDYDLNVAVENYEMRNVASDINVNSKNKITVSLKDKLTDAFVEIVQL